jgi:hypothetical protein
MPGRIGVGAEADDAVRQHHRHARIGESLAQFIVPHRRVDHRMRAAPRELVGAEIDDAIRRPVLIAPPRPGNGSVRDDAATCCEKDQLRLGAQGPSGEKADHAPRPGRHRGRLQPGCDRLAA